VTTEPADSTDAPPPADLIAAVSDDEILSRLAVLSAAGLPYCLEYDSAVAIWDIYVPTEYSQAASGELADYESANRDWPPAVPPDVARASDDLPGSAFAGLLAAAFLAWVYQQTGPADRTVRVFQEGCANSTAILAGEYWRVLTALTLHADISHVVGNAACTFLLGWALCHQLGSGVALGLALLSGVIGNAGTALLTGPGRVTLGASTAAM